MYLFDLHCDTLSECYDRHIDLTNDKTMLALDRLEFEKWIQVFAIFIPDQLREAKAIQRFDQCYKFFKDQLKKQDAKIKLFDKNYHKSSLCNAILAVEGGSVLAGDLERVKYLAACGVKILTLTWNDENGIASGALTNKGLTDFGKELIPVLEQNDIIIDVSHLNDRSFEQVAAIAKRPVIASHSNSRDICPNRRNLRDDQFLYIIQNGGIVGFNFVASFLAVNGEPSIRQTLAHIYHFLELGGKDHICLGSDFDGAVLPSFLDRIEKIDFLYENMLKSRMNKKMAHQIFYGNAERFFCEYFKIKR